MNILAVGGTFDEEDGKPSGYFGKLMLAVQAELQPHSYQFINGGNYSVLQRTIQLMNDAAGLVIIWFADVPNHLPKLAGEIKKKAPRAILFTSKRNDCDDDEQVKYTHVMLMARALQTKSNLLVELDASHRFIAAKIHDPLGNQYTTFDSSLSEVAEVLATRIKQLLGYTRVPSRCVGSHREVISCRPEFFGLACHYATTFHELIHASNERFMGNLSFRCEHGFPTFKCEDLIYVSKRNIDKREITADGFVAVEPSLYNNSSGEVQYYGDHKPSVDTPIQLKLYMNFPSIRYMIHSHTYVEGVQMTHDVVPCGALEEYDEIAAVIGRDVSKFQINLRGHGSIVAAQSVDDLVDIKYVARPMPEKHRVGSQRFF